MPTKKKTPRPSPKVSYVTEYRSSKTGLIVTKWYADRHLSTTMKIKRKKDTRYEYLKQIINWILEEKAQTDKEMVKRIKELVKA